MNAMNVHHVVGGAPFTSATSAVVVVGGGLFALFAAFWLAASATGNPLFRRLLWRTIAVAAGLWIVCEVVGGHAFLSRWIDKWASRSAPPGAVATADSRETGEGELAEPLVLEMDLSQPSDAVFWEAAAAEYELVIEPMVVEPLAASGAAASGGRESFSPQPRGGLLRSPAKKTPDPVALGWLAGTFAFSVWFLGRRVLVVWFAWRHTRPAGGEVVDEVRAVVRRLESSVASGRPHPDGTRADLLQRFRVVESDSLAAPVVFGAVRPTLAVPRGFLQSLPRAQREAVLAHELVHVAGRDPLWQVVFDALAALAWWHPGAWLARRAHKTACEAAADDGAAALPGGSRALAAALVRLAREVAGQPRFGWAAVDRPGRRRSRLGRRVVRLLSRESVSRPLAVSRRSVAVRAAAVGVLILSLLFGTAVARSGDSNSAMQYGDDPMKVWQTTWRSSLAAAALAAMVGTASAAEDEGTAIVAEEEEEVVDAIELAVEEEEEEEVERLEGSEDDVEESSVEPEFEDDARERHGRAESSAGITFSRPLGVRAAEAELRRAQLALDRLVEQQAVRQKELAVAEVNLAKLQSEVAHSERLAEKGYVKRAELEAARSALKSARQALQAKQRQADALAAQADATKLQRELQGFELRKQRDKLLRDVRDEIDATEKSSRANSDADRRRRELAEAWTRAQREIELSLARAKEQHSAEPEQMSKHLLQLLELARAEAAEGREEWAEAIMERVRELARVARMRPADRAKHLAQLELEDQMRSMSEVQLRVRHLMQAAENLRAAGKDDLAEELLLEAKKIAESEPRKVELRIGEGKPLRRIEVRPVEGKPVQRIELRLKDDPKPNAEAEKTPAVDELRREMNELKSQMNDMRAMLERIVEQVERDE